MKLGRKPPARPLTRDGLITSLAARLSRAEYPRAMMLGFVGLASSVGFLLSAGMLAVGITVPAIRYPLAAVGGYLAFLAVVRLWLAWRRDDSTGDHTGDIRFDGTGDLGSLTDTIVPTRTFGGGGGFSGGGSSGSFGDAGGAGEFLGAAAGDADEGIVWLVPVVIAVAVIVGLGASVSVLYEAPALLAEVLLDGAIATAVYRRVRLREAEHWSAGVLRRTWKPMLAITVTLFALGIAIPFLVPGADSIGDLLR